MPAVVFDYTKLRGRIRERFGSERAFAEALCASQQTVSAKLNNKTLFTQEEIRTACTVLQIKTADIPTYFFTEKVQDA